MLRAGKHSIIMWSSSSIALLLFFVAIAVAFAYGPGVPRSRALHHLVASTAAVPSLKVPVVCPGHTAHHRFCIVSPCVHTTLDVRSLISAGTLQDKGNTAIVPASRMASAAATPANAVASTLCTQHRTMAVRSPASPLASATGSMHSVRTNSRESEPRQLLDQWCEQHALL
jgi:hypothetical protein